MAKKQLAPFKPAKSGGGIFNYEHQSDWPKADDADIIEPPKRGSRRNSGIFEEVMSDKFSWTKEQFMTLVREDDKDGEEKD